jgi:hypothetical protein
MKKISFLLIMCLILVLFFTVRSGRSLPLYGEETATDELDSASKEKIVEEIAKLITDKYIFPDVAKEMVIYIRGRLKENAYDHIKSLRTFTRELTKDLRSVNNDAHLGVIERRGPFKKGGSPQELYKSFYLKRGPFRNYGFIKAERLLGNVGCLVIDEFTYVEMDGKNFGGETAKAAMTLVSNCRALIIDFRDNFGGRDEMALLLLSYFFEKPVHILTKSYREQEEKEIWTLDEISGGILDEIPLYILTSQHTVSGGEMFAYVLKNRRRAILIGEKTRGAAHHTHLFSIENFNIDVSIPTGTTFDPLTQSDWEGKGIEPDIAVPSGKAMNVAYEAALKEILRSNVERSEKHEMEWALMDVQARLNLVALDESALKEYVGEYGERRIKVEKDCLVYRKEGNPAYELSPMAKDTFSFVDKSMFYVRVRFERDESGAVNKIILMYDTGQNDEFQKTGE